MKKKVITLMLAAVMGMSLIACSGGSKEPQATNGSSKGTDAATSGGTTDASGANDNSTENTMGKSDETITIALSAEPSTMMSVMSQGSTDSITILGYLCDRLVEFDIDTKEVSPALATEWEYTDDSHIKFKLRDDVIAADGSKLTANDVYYTFESAVELAPTLDMGKFINIEETEVIDDTTIIIGLSEPLPDFLSTLAETGFSIISKSAVEAVGGLEVANTQNPNVGSGKYLLKEWKQGEYMTLERNEEHWDKDWEGYYKDIKFVFINDSASRTMAVESGDAQIAHEIPMNQAKPLMGNDKIKVLTYADGSIAQVYFNCTTGTTGAFNDPVVREAASMVIDREALRQVLTAGTGELAQGIIAPQNEYYTQVLDSLENNIDVEGAKKLLADAGYTGTIEARAITIQKSLEIFTVIQENLRQIGIELTVDTVDTPQFIELARPGDYDMAYGTQTYPVRNATLFCLFDTTQNMSLIGGPKYGNEELDKLIVTAKTSTDKEETEQAFKSILEEITEQHTFLGICSIDMAYLAAPNLEGVQFWQRGVIDVTNAYPAQ